jgi:hypothetical protein
VLREERTLRTLESGALRKMLGPKRKEVPVDWRILHNEELHNIYFSTNIIRGFKSRRMR